MDLLKEDERLDYLLGENLKIIQSPKVFSFSLDAVLLSNFTSVSKSPKRKIVDLCSGNGVIPLFLSVKTSAQIIGVEIQERLCEMAIRSVQYNKLESQIQMMNFDLKEAVKRIGSEKYDVITCNPPYFQSFTENELNENEHFTIARHEIRCTLEDVVQVSSQLLKQGGKANFVHRPGRLIDLIMLMRKFRLEPKRLQFIYPKQGKEANMILIEGIKDGKADLKVLPPFVVYQDDNEYTEEMRKIVYG
ncbi:MAG: methyltransferase small [Bacillales bacterium]|jgi:tRNA1(Val) A37 N6-methylase TrmN6|nr:methyltransferase small [Bacillales bacterium]